MTIAVVYSLPIKHLCSMSADNYLKIYKTKDTSWQVEERSTEGHLMTNLGEWADLESAIKAANEYQEENEVEYGLQIQV